VPATSSGKSDRRMTNIHLTFKRLPNAVFLLAAATLVLAVPTPASAQAQVSVTEIAEKSDFLELAIDGVRADEALVSNGEVVVYFSAPIDVQNVDALAEARANWIETIEYGYDSLVIRFAQDVALSAEIDTGAVRIRATRTATDTDQLAPGTADPEAIRLEYYRALVLLETGNPHGARAILVEQLRRDPTNIEIILLLAQAEERLRRPRRAIALYDKALALDPNLPAAIRDRRRLNRDTADTFGIETRYQDVTNGETQVITTLDGQISSTTGFALSFEAQNRALDSGTVSRPNGDNGQFDGDRQRAELTLATPANRFGSQTASVFGSNQVAGAGIGWEYVANDTTWQFEGLYSEPDFNFVEGIVEGGSRDRVAGSWRRQLSDLYELSAGMALNHYSLSGDHAGTGSETTAEIRRVIAAPWPFATVGYRFDAEYMLNSQTNDLTGANLLPLSSRETHNIDVSTEGYLTDFVRARGLAGYTYDRLNGGGGPQGEVSLIYEPLDDLEITTTLGTSLTASRGTDNQLIYGGISLRTRF
jgi:tetratricopeptide (TPR) repeat protein